MALNQKEFDLLASLAESEGRLTQRELAEKTGCALGTVNRILRQAEENGLVRDGSHYLQHAQAAGAGARHPDH